MTATTDVPRKVSFSAAARILAERDPVIARLLEQTGPPRLSRPQESHFATLVRAIVYQQLAGRAAAAIHGRLIAALGGNVQPDTKEAASLSEREEHGISLETDRASCRKAESPCQYERCSKNAHGGAADRGRPACGD